uniref:glycosyltransferase family 2 protein n=1 Tax=Alistipes sp. TaxID=1872444 RepID=UPI0040569CE4
MKLLSIIVPAYNMEAYLAQCVESILRTPSLAAVEIIIVNDGSKDKTLRIARQYAERYADTVRVVDKPNGNYGSTINAALPLVQGEYVKILDADDSFDGSRVAEMLAFLRKMQGVDMVVTPFVEVKGRRERRVEYNIYGRKLYEYGKSYDADKVFADGAMRYFMMHGICYRTAMLRDMGYRQSEGISYTDQEWVFYPLFRVKTIAFADIPLYRYNLSREGQTMDAKVQMRSLAQLVAVTEAMAYYFVTMSRSVQSGARLAILRNVVADRMRIVYRKYLLVMDNQMFAASDFQLVDARLMRLADQCGIESLAVPVNNILRVDLLRPWLRRNRRYSALVRHLLLTADNLMQWVYAVVFGH